MSNISEAKLREIIRYYDSHTEYETITAFGIKEDTFRRYLCKAKHLELELPARILVLDIETTPILLYAWTIHKPHPNHYDVFQDWHLLSWSAKWLLDEKIMSDVLSPEEAKAHNDARICESMWSLLDDADIIIAHNANRFDVGKMNTRFMLNGMKPPTPYRIIDTLTSVRSVGGFTSNKLDYLGKLVKGEGKLENPRGLWKDCFWGDPEALKHMEEYNKEDVFLLEDIYLFIRPWIKNHPNVGVYMFADEPRCAICGSSSLYEEGVKTTNVGMYRTWRCNDCGGLSKERRTSIPLKNRKVLLSSIT